MSQQIVSTWDGVQNTNSWVHDGDVERSAVDIVELASSVAGYSAGAQAAADAASGYADTASAAVASIGTAATDAVAAVQDEGAAQISALVDAGGVQSALIGSAGAAQISDIVTSGGVVTSAIADAGSAEIADIVGAGGAQVALVSAAGTSATGDLAAVTAAQSAALVSAGGYQAGLVASAGTATIALVQAEGATQTAAISASVASQVNIATSAAIVATSAATVASSTVSALTSAGSAQIALVQSAGSAQIALVNSTGATQSAAVVSAGGAQITAVNSAGAVQSASVVSAGAAQITSIGSAGAAQISAVTSTGGVQVGLVQSAGTAQIALVQSAGAAEVQAIEDAGEVYQAQIDDNAQRIENINDYAEGQLFEYQTDSTEAYTKSVPDGVTQNAEVQSIAGKTVVWNQLVQAQSTTETKADVTVTYSSDGKMSFSGTATADTYFVFLPVATIVAHPIRGHKAYIAAPAGASVSGYYVWHTYTGQTIMQSTIFTFTDSNGWALGGFTVRVLNGTNMDGVEFYPQFNDLTSLYGAGNEPSTVEQFRAEFPAAYYAYNPGTLLSAGVTDVKSVGKNLCDLDTAWAGISTATKGADGVWTLSSLASIYSKKIWENSGAYTGQIAVQYERKDGGSSGVGLRFKIVYTDGTYDIVGTFSRVTEWTQVSAVSSDSKIVSYVDGTYNNSIECYIRNAQIELGSTATAYTPYQSATLTIPASVQALPGYGWSAGSAKNVLDLAGKTFTQNVASVDMGTLVYSYNASYGFLFDGRSLGIKNISTNTGIANILSAKYTTTSYNAVAGGSTDMSIGYGTGVYCLISNNAYTDVASFKAAMSGVMLYYELASPVVTAIDPLDTMLAVEDGGTIEFQNANGAGYRIPVESSVRYQEAVDLAGRVPAAPSTDGTYTLQCTVADGVATYSWVSE